MTETIHVAVAVIVNSCNEVCISLRHKDAHQGGLWEFPGGKIEQGESVEQALAREIQEELNLHITSSRPLITVVHDYADKKVCLHVCKVLTYTGTAAGIEGQEVKWLPVSELPSYDFPAANLAIIKALQLPEKYLITGSFLDKNDFINKLEQALDNKIELIQLRLKNNCKKNLVQAQYILEQASYCCKQHAAKLMLNLSPDYLQALDLSSIDYSGFHVDSKTLMTLSQRLSGRLFSASCHNKEELQKARQLQADFVVLSPVQKTASHPEADAMGWQQFTELVKTVSVPVYALGGLSENDLQIAWQHGAQGIAAISAFWKS